ncbi:MAG: thiolase family protein [Candidatus Hydrogenedentes bacterium]|nr:thiolase family protein [Candidatus Hydrogenedentota bacterium]
MRDAFIVEAVRTPLGRAREDGILHGFHPVDLLALTLSELVARAGVDKGDIEDIIAGCTAPTGLQGANIPRLALLKAGFPYRVAAVQIDRMCGSSQQAVHFAAQAIVAGDMDLVIAGGIEMMSHLPMGTTWGVFTDEFLAEFPYQLDTMGVCAEKIAAAWGLSREELDEVAAASHERAARATEKGWFRGQIVPVTIERDGAQALIDTDEGIRPNPNRERMAALKPAFQEAGVVTAANSSQLTDGAVAILLASEEKAERLGLRKRCRVVARVAVGSDPELTLTGPIPATREVLRRAGLGIGDMDVIEVNEAFASVVLAWARELDPPMERVNVNGGAIAMGHPLGATGGVLMTKLVHELERTGGRYGLQAMCIGYGQGTATIIERV